MLHSLDQMGSWLDNWYFLFFKLLYYGCLH